MPRPNKPWFRRQTGWWQTEFNGVTYKLARGFDQKVEAVRKFHELMAEAAANPPVDGGDPTVASLLDAYLDDAIENNRPRTFAEKKYLLQRFTYAYGTRLVKQLKAYDLTKWLNTQTGWKSAWSRSNGIKVIKGAFAWGVRQELIPRNPFAAARQSEGPNHRPMTGDEFRRLLRAARAEERREGATSSGRRFRQAVIFLRLTGARPSELRDLTWPMLNLELGLAELPEHKTRHRSKEPRRIYLVPLAVRLLQAIGRSDGFEGYVFKTHRGGPWSRNALQQHLRRLRNAAQLPEDAVLYGNRHNYVTQSLMNGVGIAKTAKLVGHASTRVLNRYIHIEDLSELGQAARQATTRRRRSRETGA